MCQERIRAQSWVQRRASRPYPKAGDAHPKRAGAHPKRAGPYPKRYGLVGAQGVDLEGVELAAGADE
jgi:hypothetical protein